MPQQAPQCPDVHVTNELKKKEFSTMEPYLEAGVWLDVELENKEGLVESTKGKTAEKDSEK